MHCQYDLEGNATESGILYFIGGKTGLAIRAAKPEHADARLAPPVLPRAQPRGHRPLSRLLRRRARAARRQARAPPEDGPWASGYYSILFEDPDGIRLEINFVPGKGNLAEGVTLPLRARPGGAPDQE